MITAKITTRRTVRKAIDNGEPELKIAKAKKRQIDQEAILELIRLKAYELYVQRGCVDGHAEEDWVAAERIVQQAHN